MRNWTNMLPPFMHKETPFKLRDTFRTMKIWTSAVKKYCLFELHHPWNRNPLWPPEISMSDGDLAEFCVLAHHKYTRKISAMYGWLWFSLDVSDFHWGAPWWGNIFQGPKLWESQKWSSQQEMPLGKNITPCILVYFVSLFGVHSPNWDRSGASLCGFSPELSLTRLYLNDSNLSLVTFEDVFQTDDGECCPLLSLVVRVCTSF